MSLKYEHIPRLIDLYMPKLGKASARQRCFLVDAHWILPQHTSPFLNTPSSLHALGGGADGQVIMADSTGDSSRAIPRPIPQRTSFFINTRDPSSAPSSTHLPSSAHLSLRRHTRAFFNTPASPYPQVAFLRMRMSRAISRARVGRVLPQHTYPFLDTLAPSSAHLLASSGGGADDDEVITGDITAESRARPADALDTTAVLLQVTSPLYNSILFK